MPNSFSQKLRQAARERRKLSAIRGSFATVRRRQRENMEDARAPGHIFDPPRQ